MLQIFILSLFAFVFLGLIWYILCMQFRKFLKGNIKINIPQKVFHYGEIIHGSVRLHTKRDMNTDGVSIHLILRERKVAYAHGRSNSMKSEIRRFSQELADAAHYVSWTSQNFTFDFTLPELDEIPELTKDTDTKLIHRWYYNRAWKPQKYSWTLRVELNREGIQLHDRRILKIIPKDRA